MEALKRLPSKEISLFTQDNEYFFFKADILSHKITYSTDKKLLIGEKTITAQRAFEIIQMNRGGIKPESLMDEGNETAPASTDLLSQDNINRFDSKNSKRKKGQNRKPGKPYNDGQPTAQNEKRAPQKTEGKRQDRRQDKRQDGRRQDRNQNNRQENRPVNTQADNSQSNNSPKVHDQ